MDTYTLPDLPYDPGALEPHLRARILELHHDKHHAAYVTGANTTLEKLEKARAANDFDSIVGLEKTLAFNVSGHVLHSLFWKNLSPNGGGRPEGLDKGYFVKPTVFADVTPEMTIAQEEIFGPVLVIMPYDDEDDAVRIANSTVYGLAGAVQSADVDRAKRVARRIRTGQVDINGGGFNIKAPFGGYKQSGNGRELGKFGLDEFLEVKSLQL